MDNESLDNSRNSENEGYMREVKAIIGGVLGKENNKEKKLVQITFSLLVVDSRQFFFSILGFWGGVGGLGTVFLVVVLTQRHCCKEDGGKDDADG